jgi:hypothetical protein
MKVFVLRRGFGPGSMKSGRRLEAQFFIKNGAFSAF